MYYTNMQTFEQRSSREWERKGEKRKHIITCTFLLDAFQFIPQSTHNYSQNAEIREGVLELHSLRHFSANSATTMFNAARMQTRQKWLLTPLIRLSDKFGLIRKKNHQQPIWQCMIGMAVYGGMTPYLRTYILSLWHCESPYLWTWLRIWN